MTMNVVLGDGELPAKELDALLRDMWEKANKVDDPFWFLIQGKAEPTPTDQAMIKWLIANDVYYEMISDGSEADIYEGFQKKYTVKRLAPKVVSLMQETPDAGEEARLLALFASDDPEGEEDRWLNDVIQAVADANFKVLAMNDGMQAVKVVTVPDEEAEIEETVTEPRKAAATKKAAAQPPIEEVEEPSANGGYTREQLEEMNLDQLKEVAAKVGIELPPRTRMATYVEAILGNDGTPEIEITEVPEVPSMPYVNTGTANTNTTYQTLSVSAPAMLIVVYNGTVVSRAITEQEARSLMA
jgi:hypothetical protein